MPLSTMIPTLIQMVDLENRLKLKVLIIEDLCKNGASKGLNFNRS